ncbi:MAG: hypothetical protein PHC28_07815 [Flavobacterium sp.]|uniref:hypothetical protein n=1 Tax=Flavobacterium sp. TaxID=239 RepID=UPI0026286426|nr:hypothetical protein [Flavobacterium sp.]MDD5150378.1 hypothetical protein [Flavobacterium sp.]
MNTIDAILNKKVIDLAKEYQKQLRYTYEGLVESFGISMKGIYASGYSELFKTTIKPICDYSKDVLKPNDPNPYIINEDKLEKFSIKLAQDSILQWKAKIIKKIGNIKNIHCENINSTSFYITGEFNEYYIKIEQQMIVNISSKGKLFNQFPARIYVDGKKISESKYKQLIKTE